MRLSRLAVADYDRLKSFVTAHPFADYSAVESRESFASFLKRNSGLSFKITNRGTIIGTILCAHDGTRGYMHHISIADRYRGLGFAQMLIDASLLGLRRLGIRKCHIFVDVRNAEGQTFWRSLDWSEQPEITVYSHDIEYPSE